MDGDKVAVKRSRSPSGQNEEHGAEGRKLFCHHRMDCESRSEQSHGRSVSDTPASHTSFSLPSSFGDYAEPMEVSDPTDETLDETGKKKEKISQDPKMRPDSTSKQNGETEYKHRISVDRGHQVAQYEINLRLCKGSWGKKSYRQSAKKELLKCIYAAGNSYGNNVLMDCSETEFGSKGDLNSFYKSMEENELRELFGEEQVQKKATLENELSLHVPMFKKFKSLKTNAFYPKFESVLMKKDDHCREVLQDVKTCIRDGSKRLNNFNELENKINSYLENLKYGRIINDGKESPSIQFKFLSPQQKEDFTKECLSKGNKLQKYVSAFATYDGGVILYGIEDGGSVKGQILSSAKSENHSFEKICESLKKTIPNQTLWWYPDNDKVSASQAQKYFSIFEYRIQDKSIPETVSLSRKLSTNEYLAVICIKIKPFVDLNDPHRPRDGIVFGSKNGPKAYRIDDNPRDIHRLTYEEWLKEIMVKSEIENVTDKLQRMQLSFDQVSEKVPVFQLHDSAKIIREKIYKVTEDYDVHPKDFIPDSLSKNINMIKVKFQGFGSKGIILGDQENCQSVIHLFVISNKHGLHLYLIPSSRSDNKNARMYDGKELKDHLQRKAIALKSSLCGKGGCTKDLEIHTEVVGSDGQIHIPKASRLTSLEVNEILDSYIRLVGSFENKILSKQIGVEIFNVLTESQFQILTQYIQCRELWIHGLAGSGKTILAQLFMKRLVETGEGTVLYVAENQGLIFLMRNLLRDLEGVQCMTRMRFMGEMYVSVRNIVFDEVHHYRVDDGDWLKKGRELISMNRPEDSENEGYMWMFVDMFQKENKFSSGIPPIHKQKPRVELLQIVRCTPSIWEKVREKLKKVKLSTYMPDETAEVTEKLYKKLLEKSTSPHNIVVEDRITEKASARSQEDEFALFFQVADIISELRIQHWRAEDIAVLFSTVSDAQFFRKQYNQKKNETLIECTDDTKQNHCVCDSVRRFAGLDKPCVILVEPTVKDRTHDLNAFEALGMSRAMVKLIIIEKQRN